MNKKQKIAVLMILMMVMLPIYSSLVFADLSNIQARGSDNINVCIGPVDGADRIPAAMSDLDRCVIVASHPRNRHHGSSLHRTHEFSVRSNLDDRVARLGFQGPPVRKAWPPDEPRRRPDRSRSRTSSLNNERYDEDRIDE